LVIDGNLQVKILSAGCYSKDMACIALEVRQSFGAAVGRYAYFMPIDRLRSSRADNESGISGSPAALARMRDIDIRSDLNGRLRDMDSVAGNVIVVCSPHGDVGAILRYVASLALGSSWLEIAIRGVSHHSGVQPWSTRRTGTYIDLAGGIFSATWVAVLRKTETVDIRRQQSYIGRPSKADEPELLSAGFRGVLAHPFAVALSLELDDCSSFVPVKGMPLAKEPVKRPPKLASEAHRGRKVEQPEHNIALQHGGIRSDVDPKAVKRTSH
jgi:hypothetical protein